MAAAKLPPSLRDWLVQTGRLNDSGFHEKASAGYCRQCWAFVWRALADGSMPATVDGTPLTREAEAIALIAGRATYDMVWRGKNGYVLDVRNAEKIKAYPAHSTPGRDVMVDHICGQELPAAPSLVKQPPKQASALPTNAPF